MNGTTLTTFLYFAYGSNLLMQRIHINNPSAKRAGIGKLKNYRLDFNTYAARWRGAVATIVPTKDSYVWGAIWEIEQKDMASLDEQEGVSTNVYFPFEVDIHCPDGSVKKCRTYQQTATPALVPISDLPSERRPSPIYLRTIVEGARESGLPEDYQKFLRSIPDNGYKGDVNVSLEFATTEQ